MTCVHTRDMTHTTLIALLFDLATNRLNDPQVEWKSLPHKNRNGGSTVSMHKSKRFALLLKIEILEKCAARCSVTRGLSFSDNQDPDHWGEEETILIGRGDLSSTCGTS